MVYGQRTMRSQLGGRRTRRGGGFRWQIALLFAVGAAIYYFMNQETVPLTGRKQLRTMDPQQEIQLGLQSYQQILSQERGNVLQSGPIVDTVNKIGAELAIEAERLMMAETGAQTGFDWTYNVIESEQANAFALPGGYTAVYTGIIPIAKNQDGLAAIMGHEIGHALAHHGAERMAQQNMKRIIGAGVAMGAGGMDAGAQRTVMGIFGAGAQYGFSLPFSRSHESEADKIGLILTAHACYDPREAPRLWERMGENSKGAPPEFSSTHPSAETRIRQFDEWMPEAMAIYEQKCR